MKKVISLVLCLMLVMSLATTAFATQLNFTTETTGAEYSAYKLLNVTDGGLGKFAYTLNTKYEDILKTLTGETEEEKIVAYIEALGNDGIGAFAKTVFDAIKAAGIEADYVITGKTATVDQGYYMIAETKLGTLPDGSTDTYSLIMVDTVGKEDVNIETKESVPTVKKEVYEFNDSEDSVGEGHWNNSADYDIGDTVPFRARGTVSNKYESYIKYHYNFIDTMSEGLTYNKGSLVITIGTTDITEYFEITETDHGFEAHADLKAIDAAENGIVIDHNTIVVADYTATLNEKAVKGVAGNTNKIRLEYENNPYNDAEGEPENPGTTPEDTNIVFTFDGIVNKVDNQGNALEGAGFTLYKYNQIAQDWVKVGSEITGVTTFTFEGLDAGKYKLSETTVPAGYNRIDDFEFTVEAVYEYNAAKDLDELVGLLVKNSAGVVISSSVALEDATRDVPQFITNVSAGNVTTDVVNNSGSELPHTGGVGTTLFYVFGSIMFVGAAILLVTKKRIAE